MDCAPCVGRRLSLFTMLSSSVLVSRMFGSCGRSAQWCLGAENMDFSDLALKMLECGTSRDMELLVVVAWAIWCSRNLRVFEVCQGVDQVWSHAISVLSNYKEAVKFCGLGPSACKVS